MSKKDEPKLRNVAIVSSPSIGPNIFKCAVSITPGQRNDMQKMYGIDIDGMVIKNLKEQCKMMTDDWIIKNAINENPTMVLPIHLDSVNYCISKDMIIFATNEAKIKLYESMSDSYMIHPLTELEISGKLINIYTDLKSTFMFAIKKMPAILNERLYDEDDKKVYEVSVENSRSLFEGLIFFEDKQ